MTTAKKKVSEFEMQMSEIQMDILEMDPAMSLAAIFNTMRILKNVNKGDAYYENYLSMRERYGNRFFDTYQLLWGIGIHAKPKRILEIGTRTGISLCQLLSAMDHKAIQNIEKIVCVDPFDVWTSPNLVRANLKYLNLPSEPEKVEILAIKSEEYFNSASKDRDGFGFDYILVDGDHSKEVAKKDLDAAHKLLDKGGIIVFDDISTAPGECALLDVWDKFKSEHKDEYIFGEVLEGKGVGVGTKLI